MKKIKLFLAALLAIVGASSMKALEPADLEGNYLWNYKDGNVDRENTVSIAVSGDELTISDMFLDPLKATIQEEGGDTYLVIAKGQGGIYNGKSQYEVQGSADRLTGWGKADIKGKIGTDGVITFDCYLRAFIVGTGSTIGSDYGKGSTFTPLSGELPSVVELPAGAIVEEYQLAYMQLGRRKTKAVGVAIVDNDVYVQGFADFLPEAWVKGTISANKWTFPANQYLGKLDNNDCYFFSNGETTFTYNGENAYVATQVSGKVAGVVLALYIGPELSKEFDPVPYATISIDGENMTFRYDLDYYSASKEVGTSFSHVYRLPWTGYQPEWWNDVETLGKIKKVSFNASFGKYEDITDLYSFFAGMENLTTIEGLGYLVTKNAMHTASMFENCKSLTSLDLSTFDTSGITDGTMASMFNGCEKLKSITFGANFSTAGANAMQYMFYNCQALESLDLSKFDTEKVTNMANMFSGCASLKSITFGEDFKASGVKDMNDMFYNCQALKSLDLSSFDTGKVTDMQGMFGNCIALEELDVSNFNTEKVTTMQGMFYGCKALKELDLSNFNTGKVQQMYDMFYQCSSLQTIYSAENADWRNEYSGGMFRLCNKLSGKFGSKEFSYEEHPMDDGIYYAKVYDGTDAGGYFTSIKEKPEPYAVLEGSTLTFYYDGNKPTTGTVYDLPWTANTFAPWARKTEITAVEFNESFADYDGLTNLYGMFAELTKLTAITGLGYLNTENVENMAYMFSACTSLESLDVSGFNTENVTNMRNMFYNCNKLETLDVNSFNTENVTNMTNMFAGCKFTTLYCNKNWAKDDLLSDRMFYACTNLVGGNGTEYDASHVDAAYAHPDGESNPGYFTEKYAYAVLSEDGTTLTFYYDKNKPEGAYDVTWAEDDYPGWTSSSGDETVQTVEFTESFGNYHELTSTSRMFANMKALKTINGIENLNTKRVVDMNRMFRYCTGLTTLDLGDNFDTSSATNMSCMFFGCSGLTSIDLGDNFDTSNVTDMSSMFYACSGLTTLDLGDNFDTSSVKYMRFMFAFSTSLTTLDLGDNFDTSEVIDMQYMFQECKGLTTLDLGDNFDTSSVTNMDNMFRNCTGLTTLDLGDNFDTSNVTNMSSMFWYCKGLTTLDLGDNFDTSNVTDMSSMFIGCSGLTTLNLGDNFDTSNVTDMLNMFADCQALKTLDLSNFDTENVEDMSYMFLQCLALESLDVSNFNTENVTDMNNMFYGCVALKELDVSNFDTGNVTDMTYMFSYCSALTELDLSNFDTKKVTNMSYMFEGSSSLETIYCAEGADWSGVAGRNYTDMFKGCTSLSGKCGSKEFKFDPEEIKGTYAKVYDGTNGGYFTCKGNEGYTLTVTKAGMATLFLDYDAVIPNDVEVYYCTGLDDDEAVPTTHAVKINSDNLIPANTGVFVKAAPGEYVFEHPKSGQLYIVASIIGNILTGTLEDKTVEPHSVLTLGYANNEEKTLGFWWFTGKTPIPANRAYIPGDKLTEGGVKGIRIVFDEETGIKTTNLTNQTNEADAWYSIDGRKLEGKPQQRGLYINNGKKIMVK
jgi:surface protein